MRPLFSLFNTPNYTSQITATIAIKVCDGIQKIPLMNAQYGLYRDQRLLQAQRSIEEGFILFSGIRPGHYKLKELQPLKGYRPNETIYNVTVNNKGSTTINQTSCETFVIYSIPTNALLFETKDISNAPVEGIKFQLSNERIAISDSNGIVNFGILPPSHYFLKELQVPDGYVPTKQNYPVVATENEIIIADIPTETFVHVLREYQPLSFLVMNENNEFLSDVSFELSNGLKVKSDDYGNVNFGIVKAGVYFMEELTAPDGYLPNNHSYHITISDTNEIYVDQIALSSFKVIKKPYPVITFTVQDPKGEPLDGIKFELLNYKTAVSDSVGIVDFGPVAPGVYTLNQVARPDTYSPLEEDYFIEIENDGTVLINKEEKNTLTITVYPYPTLSFTTLDMENKTPLNHVLFQLSTGKQASSDAFGIVNFGQLKPGSYDMTQVNVVDGYYENHITYHFLVQKEYILANDMELSQFQVCLTPYPILLFCIKNEDDIPLSGSVFMLSNGSTAKSDEMGLINFGKLQPGYYTMKEMKAPENYVRYDTLYEVVVSQEGTILINGEELANFHFPEAVLEKNFPKPYVFHIVEGENYIHGYANAESKIQIILPDDNKLEGSVSEDGYWIVMIPSDMYLFAEQYVYVNQTRADGLTSEYAAVYITRTTSSFY